MPTMYYRDAEGGPWREYRGELLPGGAVGPPRVPPPPMTFVVGADLGQVVDYTALTVVETQRLNPGDPGLPVYSHQVSHLERHRGTLYPVIAARIVQLCAELPAPPVLVVDESGVGRAVCDEIRLANPRTKWFCPVTITPGMDDAVQPDGSWHVAKRLLVGKVQVALQRRHLKAGKNLPLTPTLVRELLTFRAKITSAGNVVYGAPPAVDWRDKSHDDLVLSVALAVWAAEKLPPFYVD